MCGDLAFRGSEFHADEVVIFCLIISALGRVSGEDVEPHFLLIYLYGKLKAEL